MQQGHVLIGLTAAAAATALLSCKAFAARQFDHAYFLFHSLQRARVA